MAFESGEIFERVLQMQENGERGVLVTVVRADGSTPRKVGTRMLIFENGEISGTIGGGQVEQAVKEQAKVVLETGSPTVRQFKLTHELAMCCGGQMTFLLEPVVPPLKLIIMGCGHVGQAILKQAAHLEFQMIAVDDLQENLDAVADLKLHQALDTYDLDRVSDLPYGPDTLVLIVTREHALDQKLLEMVLPLGNRYVGVIGSKRKAHMQRQRLLAKEFEPNLVESIVCPMGLDIGAQTPAEIAISVVAQLIEVIRKPSVSTQAGAHSQTA
jgi:xanthine dehydrogenase accessory factor